MSVSTSFVLSNSMLGMNRWKAIPCRGNTQGWNVRILESSRSSDYKIRQKSVLIKQNSDVFNFFFFKPMSVTGVLLMMTGEYILSMIAHWTHFISKYHRVQCTIQWKITKATKEQSKVANCWNLKLLTWVVLGELDRHVRSLLQITVLNLLDTVPQEE